MPELQNLTSIIESNPNDSALTKRSKRLYKNKKTHRYAKLIIQFNVLCWVVIVT